jgi:hypothetical protein
LKGKVNSVGRKSLRQVTKKPPQVMACGGI